MITTTWFLPVLMGAAVADSLNPCAFSILFLTIAFLFSLGKDRRFILWSGASYIFGIAFIYLLIGTGALRVLSFFSIPNGLSKFGASILIVYILISLINEVFPAFPIKLKIPQSSYDTLAKVIHKGSIPASLGLGVLVGLFEFPCTGGPYLFALSLLHDQTTFWQGLGYLAIYDVVFVMPLVIILIAASNKTLLAKVDRLRKIESKIGRVIFNIVLLGVAFYMFTL